MSPQPSLHTSQSVRPSILHCICLTGGPERNCLPFGQPCAGATNTERALRRQYHDDADDAVCPLYRMVRLSTFPGFSHNVKFPLGPPAINLGVQVLAGGQGADVRMPD